MDAKQKIVLNDETTMAAFWAAIKRANPETHYISLEGPFRVWQTRLLQDAESRCFLMYVPSETVGRELQLAGIAGRFIVVVPPGRREIATPTGANR